MGQILAQKVIKGQEECLFAHFIESDFYATHHVGGTKFALNKCL